MVMIILGNYKSNYDIATKTAQWALTPKQLSLVFLNIALLISVAVLVEVEVELGNTKNQKYPSAYFRN